MANISNKLVPADVVARLTVINEIDLLPPAMLEKLKSFMDECGGNGQIIGTTNNEHKLNLLAHIAITPMLGSELVCRSFRM